MEEINIVLDNMYKLLLELTHDISILIIRLTDLEDTINELQLKN